MPIDPRHLEQNDPATASAARIADLERRIGILEASRPPSGAALLNGGHIAFGTAGVAPPDTTATPMASAGTKLRLYGHGYGIGIDNNTLWYQAGQEHRWFAGAGVRMMNLDGNAGLTLTGSGAGYHMKERDTARVWGIYGSGGHLRFASVPTAGGSWAELNALNPDGSWRWAQNVWHRNYGGDQPRLYFESPSGVTYVRGAGIVFRNQHDTTLTTQRADGWLECHYGVIASSGNSVITHGVRSHSDYINFMHNNNVNYATTWAGTYAYGSDRALKRDVEPLGDGALARVRKLKPSRYELRANGRRTAGLVAQDVRAVIPEAVLEHPGDPDDDGDLAGTLGLDYSAITAHLIGAVDELAGRVDELGRRLGL